MIHGWGGVAVGVGSAVSSPENAREELDRTEDAASRAVSSIGDLSEESSVADVLVRWAAVDLELQMVGDALVAALGWFEQAAGQCEAAGLTELAGEVISRREDVEAVRASLASLAIKVEGERETAQRLPGGDERQEAPAAVEAAQELSLAEAGPSRSLGEDPAARGFRCQRSRNSQGEAVRVHVIPHPVLVALT